MFTFEVEIPCGNYGRDSHSLYIKALTKLINLIHRRLWIGYTSGLVASKADVHAKISLEEIGMGEGAFEVTLFHLRKTKNKKREKILHKTVVAYKIKLAGEETRMEVEFVDAPGSLLEISEQKVCEHIFSPKVLEVMS